MATVGLDRLYYSKITENTAGDETYGTPQMLAKAISADLEIELNEATLFADDSAAEVVNPILRNRNNDVWIQYVGTIPDGKSVVLDTKHFTCLQDADNMISIVKHGGDAYWMILDAGNNSMELETDMTGGNATLEYYPAFF